jgi:hypothetical protein
MEQHFQTLSLTASASLEEAHDADHKLAEQYHPDNVSNMYAKSHYRQQLIVVDKAWVAIQGHFHRKDKENLSEAKKYEWYFSYAELFFMAKHDQEYQCGAIRVRFDAKLHLGLYEEHERICIRSKGYVFDGEAEVIRDNGIDIINGSPTFKNAIFEKSVMFAPRKSLTTNNDSRLRFPKPVVSVQPPSAGTFEKATVFMEYVNFRIPVEFKGAVTFTKRAVRRATTFWARPEFGVEGFQHTMQAKHLWYDGKFMH